MASATTSRLLDRAPLRLDTRVGAVELITPIVLAPMAGITNAAFRLLCREQGAGLFISEMMTARALIERNEESLRMIDPAEGESPRSVQLYATKLDELVAAVKMIGEEELADHIDLNFGCPVPKVTRKGGGAALPYKRRLFESLVSAAVIAAKPFDIPITVKMRVGIDSEHETYLDAGMIAARLGVAWVALHARTAEQLYEGKSDWQKIANLVEHLKSTGVPVLGNGDIWTGDDGVRMMSETGCAGVVVGRGCLGRPWLFRDLVRAFSGEGVRPAPTLFEVKEVLRRHAQLLANYFKNEERACRDLRKHMAWYLKGFRVEGEIRPKLGMVKDLAELDYLLSQLEDQPYPTEVGDAPRGRRSHGRSVSLPQGWLDDPEEFATVDGCDSGSGG
ncbi:MAG: tRNA dihydrouridine synthase DusB [Actinobacteria bacterium]|nr:tRNA dihydrouridine synthase DusB [Actinomycetota bacterium]